MRIDKREKICVNMRIFLYDRRIWIAQYINEPNRFGSGAGLNGLCIPFRIQLFVLYSVWLRQVAHSNKFCARKIAFVLKRKFNLLERHEEAHKNFMLLLTLYHQRLLCAIWLKFALFD